MHDALLLQELGTTKMKSMSLPLQGGLKTENLMEKVGVCGDKMAIVLVSSDLWNIVTGEEQIPEDAEEEYF